MCMFCGQQVSDATDRLTLQFGQFGAGGDFGSGFGGGSTPQSATQSTSHQTLGQQAPSFASTSYGSQQPHAGRSMHAVLEAVLCLLIALMAASWSRIASLNRDDDYAYALIVRMLFECSNCWQFQCRSVSC